MRAVQYNVGPVCERHCIEAELFPFNTVDDLCGTRGGSGPIYLVRVRSRADWPGPLPMRAYRGGPARLPTPNQNMRNAVLVPYYMTSIHHLKARDSTTLIL